MLHTREKQTKRFAVLVVAQPDQQDQSGLTAGGSGWWAGGHWSSRLQVKWAGKEGSSAC
jgi:hypothetical protein